eukprot:6202744-Pleurochrysis_carterae.AAC.2
MNFKLHRLTVSHCQTLKRGWGGAVWVLMERRCRTCVRPPRPLARCLGFSVIRSIKVGMTTTSQHESLVVDKWTASNAEFRAQSSELRAELRAQSSELRAELRAQSSELRAQNSELCLLKIAPRKWSTNGRTPKLACFRPVPIAEPNKAQERAKEGGSIDTGRVSDVQR